MGGGKGGAYGFWGLGALCHWGTQAYARLPLPAHLRLSCFTRLPHVVAAGKSGNTFAVMAVFWHRPRSWPKPLPRERSSDSISWPRWTACRSELWRAAASRAGIVKW